MNRLFKLTKKYSINKEVLILNIKDNNLKDYIANNYAISLITDNQNLADKGLNVICDSFDHFHSNYVYDLVIFEDLLEYKKVSEIERILRRIKKNAKEIIFDVAISNYFCEEDHKNINYYGKEYYYNIIKKNNFVLVEEKTYRKNLFEKHKIFVICSK